MRPPPLPGLAPLARFQDNNQAAREASLTRYIVGIDVGGTFTDFVAYDQASGTIDRLEEPVDAG